MNIKEKISPTERRQQLERIVALSVAMCAKGRAGEWPEVAVLEAERGHLIEYLFADAITPEEAAFVAPALTEILALDAELVTLSETLRNQIAAELGQAEVGKAALAAYHQAMGT